MGTDKSRFTAVASVLLCVAASAIVLGGDQKVFSHKKHLDEGAECDTCHPKPGQRPERDLSGCQECHDQGPTGWHLPAKALHMHVDSPHEIHAGKFECIDCHRLTAEDRQPENQPLMERIACLACHEKKHAGVGEGDCAACHGVDERRVAPDNHGVSWEIRHGREAQWQDSGEHGRACSLCHSQATCLTCHKSSRPRNHTALWRMRTHGAAAAWDRQSCMTCHETGACVRCHKTTAPMNHRGAWNAVHGLSAQVRDNQHCVTCHSKAWCAACHAGK
jgi:hypothetical protein